MKKAITLLAVSALASIALAGCKKEDSMMKSMHMQMGQSDQMANNMKPGMMRSNTDMNSNMNDDHSMTDSSAGTSATNDSTDSTDSSAADTSATDDSADSSN